jgi:hypothetical protein
LCEEWRPERSPFIAARGGQGGAGQVMVATVFPGGEGARDGRMTVHEGRSVRMSVMAQGKEVQGVRATSWSPQYRGGDR